MQNRYNTLSGYKNDLTKGSDDVKNLNLKLNNLDELFLEAINGDFYSVDNGTFNSYLESSPDNDGKINSAKNYIQREMDGIKADIEEEERRKREEEARKKEEARKILEDLLKLQLPF